MLEEVEKRTLNSKTFDLGGGKHDWYGTVGALHYDDSGQLIEIDNILEPSIAPWNWEMVKAAYNVRIKSDFDSGQIIQFERGGESVAFQPMNLEFTNDLDQIQLINNPQAVAGDVTNPLVGILPHIGLFNHEGTARWWGAYGSGIDFQWKCTPTRLVKTLEIDSFSNLPAPAQYIIDGGNPVMRLNLIFAPSSNLEIYVNGELWDQKKKVQTFGIIEFKKDGETLWGSLPLRYWDSNNEAIERPQSVATLEKKGNSLYISIRVPYSWLQSAVYPVFVDVDVDVQVAASTDDCKKHWNGTAWVFDTTSTFLVGYNSSTNLKSGGGLRFLNVTVPSGAIIDTAHLTATCRVAKDKIFVNSYIHGELAANPVTFSDVADYDARVRTTAVINWDAIVAGVVDTEYDSPQIDSIINEIIGQGGWASGQAMVIFWDDHDGRSTASANTSRIFYSYDDNSAKCIVLHIVYITLDGEILRPNAAGDLTNILACFPDTGEAHWEDVDEVNADGAATYIRDHDTSVYHTDLYNLPAHSVGSGTINYVTVYCRGYTLTTPNQDSLKCYCKTNGSVYSGTAETMTADKWLYYYYQWVNNPQTTAAWTWSEIDALQIGVSLRSPNSGSILDTLCTQIFVVVNYTAGGAILYGVVAMAGTGTMTALGKALRTTSLNITGVGTLSSAGKALRTTSLNIAGIGSMTISGKRLLSSAISIAGAGILTLVGSTKGLVLGAISMVGAGTATFVGKLLASAAIDLSGVGTLSAIGKRRLASTISLVGTGTLISVGKKLISSSLSLSGVGTLTSAGKRLLSSSLNLSGVGTLTSAGKRLISSSLSLAGIGTLTSAGRSIKNGILSLSGTGTFIIAVATSVQLKEIALTVKMLSHALTIKMRSHVLTVKMLSHELITKMRIRNNG